MNINTVYPHVKVFMNNIERYLLNLGFEILDNKNFVTRYFDFIYDGHICYTFVENTNCFYSHYVDSISYYHTDMRDNKDKIIKTILRQAKAIIKANKLEQIAKRKDALNEDFE